MRLFPWILLAACSGAATEKTPSIDFGEAVSPPLPSSAADGSIEPGTSGDAGIAYEKDPPPPKAYTGGVCPTLTGDPNGAINANFKSGTQSRQFRLLVPSNYDGTEKFSLLFAWHWLNSSGNSIIQQGQLVAAAPEEKYIVIAPDELVDSTGKKVYEFDWPFVELPGATDAQNELTFFDDMLACVSQQYNVDLRHVHGIGASAGALWLDYLASTDRVDYVASIASLSGGLAEDPTGTWKMTYTPQANKFPAVVLWGGPLDWFILDFNAASMRYRDALKDDHHFVVSCTHMSGHALPPLIAPPGGTIFQPMWDFFRDHPYGLPPGTSPYQKAGLPSTFPSWCEIYTP